MGAATVAVSLAVAVACSGKSDPPVGGGQTGTGGRGALSTGGTGGGRSGSGGAGGTSGSGNMEAGAAGEPVVPGGPIVQITSPAALGSPSDGDVLTAPELTVLCEVRADPNGSGLNASTVFIELLDADENTVEEVAAARTGEPDEFSARVILTKVPDNGRIGFRCSAADSGSPALTGVDTAWSFVDHGPEIVVTSPVPDSAHALLGDVRFRFSVNAAPVAKSDSEAAVDDVTLEIAGVGIDPGKPDNGDYDVSVDLADTNVFPDTPSGTVPVTITATNKRSPDPAERVVSYGFVIDGEGPDITITSPKNEAVVGGQVALRFSVTDALSGVDEASVTVELNGKEHRFGEGGTWSHNGDDFVFLFDSTQAEKDSKIQATLVIRASDTVGNTASGESLLLYLDNIPPVVDLDPPNVRESKRNTNSVNGTDCSASFDPLGTKPPNDYPDSVIPADTMSPYSVPRAQIFRALVWERTNQIPGQSILRYSGTNEDSVFIYIQPAVATPLLVDTTNDGQCDELAVSGLQFQHMKALTPAGAAWYDDVDSTKVPDTTSECSLLNQNEPAHLCTSQVSDMTRVIAHEIEGHPPVIYALGQLNPGIACTGTDWEIGSIAPEGWVCLAARAVDNAGNVGISPPLALCYDDPDTSAQPSCATTKETPPDCTDGCLPPVGFTARILAPP